MLETLNFVKKLSRVRIELTIMRLTRCLLRYQGLVITDYILLLIQIIVHTIHHRITILTTSLKLTGESFLSYHFNDFVFLRFLIINGTNFSTLK